jgi:hypothetical protein
MKLFILLLISLQLFPQFRDDQMGPDPRSKFIQTSNGSLFDMNRLSVSHSFSTGFYSYGSRSLLINEYIAGLNYKFSDPLTLRLDMGVSYTPYSSMGITEENKTDIYFKSATLDYRPNDTFRMRIDVRNITPSDHFFNSGSFMGTSPLTREE